MLHTKVSGSWKEASNVHTRVSGVWREVDTIHTKVSGVWREVYSRDNGVDDYTKLLLHCDGGDTGTIFTDSSKKGHKVTTYGNAQIDTAQYKFGTASALFDGNGDYLEIPDSDDWAFGTNDFTIDLWVRFNALPSSGQYHGIIGQYADTNNYSQLFVYNSDGATPLLRFYSIYSSSTVVNLQYQHSMTTGVWYHIALTRSGNDFKLYLDGAVVSTASTSNSLPNWSVPLHIGKGWNYDPYAFNGWMDEIRVCNGVARWNAAFNTDLPYIQYGTKGGNDINCKLLLHFNGTNNSTEIADSSWSNPKAISISGDAKISTAQSVFGSSSLYLDGNGDSINAGSSTNWCTSNLDFTIDFRLRLPSLPSAYKAVFSNRQGSGSYYYGMVCWITDANKIAYVWYDTNHSSYIVITNNAISANTWYHVAAVRDGNTLKMYLDGVAQTQTADVTGKTNYDPSIPFTIGTDGAYGTYYVNAYIDEFRFMYGSAWWKENFNIPTKEYV